MGASAGLGYPRNIFVYESCGNENGLQLEDLECCICLNICNNPKQCPNGHMFCSTCIETAIVAQNKCPTCRIELNKDKLSVSLIVKKQISALSVRCPVPPISEEDKCLWTGKVAELENHLGCCEYQRIKCTNTDCDVHTIRKDLNSHLSVCPYQLEKCKYCNEMFLRRDLEAHFETCTSRVMPCPNEGCQESTTLNYLQSHLEVCMFEMVPCPLKEEGLCGSHCPTTLLRKDLDDHMVSPATVAAMMRGTLTIKRQMTSLTSEIEKLKVENTWLQRVPSSATGYHSGNKSKAEEGEDEEEEIKSEMTTRHHPCSYLGGKWDCCLNAGRSAVGCHTGTVRHHPGYKYIPYQVGGRLTRFFEGYACCMIESSSNRMCEGCEEGPHPNPFEDQLPNNTNGSRHHTAEYRYGSWDCCSSEDRNATGCQTGPVMHHAFPFYSSKYVNHGFIPTDRWGCCRGSETMCVGCKEGPHPDPFP